MSACECGCPSWHELADLALEVQQLREILFDEDTEALAHRLATARQLIDGTTRDVHGMPYHRAIAREVLLGIEGQDANDMPAPAMPDPQRFAARISVLEVLEKHRGSAA